MKKRILSLLICVALCLTLLPATALAAGGTYLALGDSITTGYAPGNTTVASPFAGQVQAMGGYASLSNHAAEGETTQTLKDKLPGLRSDIAGASLITITIGGNDLMDALYGYLVESYNAKNPTKPITLESLKAALMDLSNPMNQLMLLQVISYIGGFDGSSAETAALDTFEANLGGIIDQIRRENPSAPIVIATQYNPYRHITDQSAQGIVAAFETGVVHLNERLTKVAGEKGLLVADVYTAFRDDGGQLTNAAFSMSDLKTPAWTSTPTRPVMTRSPPSSMEPCRATAAKPSCWGQAEFQATTAQTAMTISILETGRRRMKIRLPVPSNGGYWMTRPTTAKQVYFSCPKICWEAGITETYISIDQAGITSSGKAVKRRRGAGTFTAVIFPQVNRARYLAPRKATRSL